MAVLNIDDFKAKLKGGGARPNLFKATINFPAYAQGDVEITSFMCKAATLPGSLMGIVEVPFRGRLLKIAGDQHSKHGHQQSLTILTSKSEMQWNDG